MPAPPKVSARQDLRPPATGEAREIEREDLLLVLLRSPAPDRAGEKERVTV